MYFYRQVILNQSQGCVVERAGWHDAFHSINDRIRFFHIIFGVYSSD